MRLCVGRLKGSFRILRCHRHTWVSSRPREQTDNVFLTCCVLHSKLNAYDVLHSPEPDMGWSDRGGMLNVVYCDLTTNTAQVSMSGMRGV
ncbi:unnamed protein product [Discosporangium mesarthrocarpum]